MHDLESVPDAMREPSMCLGYFDGTGYARPLSEMAEQIAGIHLSSLEGFGGYHPQLPATATQGALECIYEVQHMCASMAAMEAVSLVALSASQASFAGLSIIKKHFLRQKVKRNSLLLCSDLPGVHDAAQKMDFKVTCINNTQIADNIGPQVAAIIFSAAVLEADPLTDTQIQRIQEQGVLMYVEGCNQYFNQLLVKQMKLLPDLVTLDLGMMCEVTPPVYAILTHDKLKPYLPLPYVEQAGNQYQMSSVHEYPLSIGYLNTTGGNIESILRCYVQLKLLGMQEIQKRALKALVCSRYLVNKLAELGMPEIYEGLVPDGQTGLRLEKGKLSRMALENMKKELPAMPLLMAVRQDRESACMQVKWSHLHYLNRNQLDTLVVQIKQHLQQHVFSGE